MIDQLFSAGNKLPIILQTELTECGLACVAMVSSYYGHRIDLNTLRRRYPVSSRGATLSDIMSVSTSLSLESRPLRLEMEQLSELRLPAILHWDFKHFVVLKRFKRNAVVIHDPAVGERTYSILEAGRHFTGVALELTPTADFTRQTEEHRSKIKDLFVRYPGFYSPIFQLVAMSILLQVGAIGSSFYVQLLIDEGITRDDRDLIAVLAIGFLLLGIARTVMSWLRSYVLVYFSNQLSFQMVGNVFNHLIRLPVEYFEKRHVGDLVSRFGSIESIRTIITDNLVTVVLDGLFAFGTLAVMYFISPFLATLAFIFVTMAALFRFAVIPRIQSLQEQQIVAEAKTSSGLMENMRTIEVIKFFCKELPRIRQWKNDLAKQVNTSVNLQRFTINVDAVNGTLFTVENVAVIYVAALLVLDGSLTIGFMIAFISLKSHFSTSIKTFLEKLVQLRLVRLQLERVSDITCSEREFDNFELPRFPGPIQGGIELVASAIPILAAKNQF